MHTTFTKILTAAIIGLIATTLFSLPILVDPTMIVASAMLSLATIAFFKAIDIDTGGTMLAFITAIVASLLFAPQNSYFSIDASETTSLFIVGALIFATQFMNFFKILENRDYLAYKIIQDAKQYQHVS